MQAQRNATTRPQMVCYRPGAPKQTRGYRQPVSHYTSRDVRQAFKAGLLIGLTAALVVCGLILWFWAVPTVDGAVETSKQALDAAMSGAVVSA